MIQEYNVIWLMTINDTRFRTINDINQEYMFSLEVDGDINQCKIVLEKKYLWWSYEYVEFRLKTKFYEPNSVNIFLLGIESEDVKLWNDEWIKQVSAKNKLTFCDLWGSIAIHSDMPIHLVED
jgi:hypothetical protein